MIEKLATAYKNKAHIFIMYIREAHPTDGRALPNNKFVIPDPKTLEERRQVAKEFADQLKASVPILVDTIDDQVEKAYAGWPDRVYILDGDGIIVHKGGVGPAGFRPSLTAAPGILDRLINGSNK